MTLKHKYKYKHYVVHFHVARPLQTNWTITFYIFVLYTYFSDEVLILQEGEPIATAVMVCQIDPGEL